jgi:hypothetical protein
MNKLPNDYCRCTGSNCSIKESCLRHTYQAPVDPAREVWGYPHSTQLCDTQEKIYPYWISNEQKS